MSLENKPLTGIRVLEQGAFISGPFASMLLADLGADVIKIERPGTGDPFRSYEGGLYSSTFQSVNRNKRGITLDNREESDQVVFRQLVSEADVFIHNFRPVSAKKLGIDAETLHQINSGLVHCAISGFGADGPYAERPSYDTVAQALSGYLSLTTDPERPRIAGPAMADAVTGLYAAQAVTAALVRRATSEEPAGAAIEVPMFTSMAAFAVEPFGHLFAKGVSPGPYGRAAVSQSYVLGCRDGRSIALHLSSPQKFWEGLLASVDRRDLLDDPRFAERAARVAHHEELRQELAKTFATRDSTDLLEQLIARDVPCAPVHELDDVLRDPQAIHMGIEIEAEHPAHGALRTIRSPMTFDGVYDSTFVAPPDLGEHNESVRARRWAT